jgi:hypothetical protein
MFRYRQSSLVFWTPAYWKYTEVCERGFCMHCGAYSVAARTPCHGTTGCGGCQRSAPSGGAANGTPRYARTAALARQAPEIWPPSTVSGSPVVCASAGVARPMARGRRQNPPFCHVVLPGTVRQHTLALLGGKRT